MGESHFIVDFVAHYFGDRICSRLIVEPEVELEVIILVSDKVSDHFDVYFWKNRFTMLQTAIHLLSIGHTKNK